MKNIQKRWIVAVLLTVVIGTFSCKKEEYAYTTTNDVNITGYLQLYPEQFSEWIKILKRTDTYNYLSAYGSYTCFAPTNAAVKIYLTKVGKATIEDIDTTLLKNIVRLHLIQDTLLTKQFTDGKMPSPTMLGQYLITSGTIIEGISYIRVNRQANILQSNISTVNGVIHVLDNVLEPATSTVAKMLEQNPKFSYFTQALKETGFFDSLNIANNPDTTRRWLTVLAQSDSVYNAIGIGSYAALKAKYNNTGNPKNTKDSLYLYMAYHILPNLKYLADIISAPSHPTLAPLEVVTSKLVGQTVLINDDDFNGIHEPGIELSRFTSDNSAVNGVIHYALANIFLKPRLPFRVDFDLADQPEIRKLTSKFRKNGQGQNFNVGDLKDINWQNGTANYFCEATNTTNPYWWYDHIDFNFRVTSGNSFIEFRTPLVVKGRYKLWIMNRRNNQGTGTQVSVDGVVLPRILNFTAFLPSSTASAADLEALGYKRYNADAVASNTNQNGLLAGVVDITTTDRHIVRLDCVAGGSQNNLLQLDMLQFIPVLDNQLRPLFKQNGTLVP